VYSDDPGRTPEMIHTHGLVQGLLAATPSLIVLPRISGGRHVYSSRCMLQSTNGQPVHSLVFDSPEDIGIACQSEITSAEFVFVVLTWDPRSAGDGEARRTVKVRCKVGEADADLTIQVLCAEPRGSP